MNCVYLDFLKDNNMRTRTRKSKNTDWLKNMGVCIAFPVHTISYATPVEKSNESFVTT